jgi:hypothetical protein
MINKTLLSIYEIWRTQIKSLQDAHIISSKIDEIYRKYQIQPSWSNRPDLQQIHNPGVLEPDRVYSILLQSTVPDDKFIAYYEIWTFLTEYVNMLRGYSNHPVPNPVSNTVKKEIPEKKKKKTIPAALKRKVWNKWIGEENVCVAN